eukprot:765362-Hanusia_phi.AAC.1
MQGIGTGSIVLELEWTGRGKKGRGRGHQSRGVSRKAKEPQLKLAGRGVHILIIIIIYSEKTQYCNVYTDFVGSKAIYKHLGFDLLVASRQVSQMLSGGMCEWLKNFESRAGTGTDFSRLREIRSKRIDRIDSRQQEIRIG